MSHQFPALAVSDSGAACLPVLLNSHAASPQLEPEPRQQMHLTRVELGRLILLSTEVGARFARDGIPYDPAAWMVAPRRLFGGRSAVDACRAEIPFMRGMLLHSLSCGLDADPDAIDAVLLEHDELAPGSDSSGHIIHLDVPEPATGPELYTAIVVSEGDTCCHAFLARMASGADEVLGELKDRLGDRCRDPEIQRGFDPSHPVACAHVSAAITELLHDVAADPTSVLANGLNVFIEHRFAQ